MALNYRSPRTSVRPDVRCSLIAAAQFGLITLDQALATGLTERQIHYRHDAGKWDRIYPTVYRLAGTPHSPEQNLLAVVLWLRPRVVVSHRPAAALWGFDDFGLGIVEVTADRKVRAPQGIVVHRSKVMPSHHRTTRGPFPVTSAVRTLIDLGAVITDEQALEIALDCGLRLRRYDLDELRRELDFMGERRHPGVAALRALVDLRRPDDNPSRSGLEIKVLRVLRRAGLPAPIRNYVARVGPKRREIDLAYPHAMVGIECHSKKHHFGNFAEEQDLVRDRDLTLLGWRIIYVTHRQLKRDPGGFVDAVSSLLNLPSLGTEVHGRR